MIVNTTKTIIGGFLSLSCAFSSFVQGGEDVSENGLLNEHSECYTPRSTDWVVDVLAKKCETVEDMAIFMGSDWDEDDFDPRNIKDPNERESLIKKGMANMKEMALDDSYDFSVRGCACDVLARLHYLRDEMKQALYWAPKGVEHGSVLCMVLLRDAYLQGNGVIPDLEEGIKWCLLAAAAGHEDSRNRTKDYSKDLASSTGEVSRILREAKRRAVEWTKAHPNVFVAP